MKRARIIALKTPNHKLRKIYSDLIAKLQKRYPTKLDFMDYTEGSFSKFFKRANIPSFEDIDAFFNNRDKEPADVQTKYDSSAEEKKVKLIHSVRKYMQIATQQKKMLTM